MENLGENHMVYHHGGPMLSTGIPHFYVVAGLCDVTKKINNKNTHYTEVIFDRDPSEAAMEASKEIKKLKLYIQAHNAVPIFCTIIPSHIESQNYSWFDRGITSHLNYSHRYDEMQSGAMEAIETINAEIQAINIETGVSTPFLHQTITYR